MNEGCHQKMPLWPRVDISQPKNDRPEYWYRQQDWYQCVDEKEEIQEFLLRSGDQNSVQCCLVSATAGEVPGWHEMKYRVL